MAGYVHVVFGNPRRGPNDSFSPAQSGTWLRYHVSDIYCFWRGVVDNM